MAIVSNNVTMSRGKEVVNWSISSITYIPPCNSKVYIKHSLWEQTKCNVNDIILWWGHHKRVMQLNWLYFCGIRQLISLNCGRTQHKAQKAATINQFACPNNSLYVQLLWYPMYYPGGMKAQVSPVQWSKPHSILAPTQDWNPGDWIQNYKRWPVLYHCTLHTKKIYEYIKCLSFQISLIKSWKLQEPKRGL